MSAPTLDLKLSLTKVRQHVRHTLLKLRAFSWAKALGTQLEALAKEVDVALASELKTTDAVADAEAVVDLIDLELNHLARTADNLARGFYSGANLKEVREALFQSESLSDFIRPTLSTQLTQMRTWPKYLSTVFSVNLKALGPSVETALKSADSAIGALTTAEVDLAAFRSGTQAALIKKINLLFHDIGSEAVKKAKETGVPFDRGSVFLSTRRHRPALTVARARAEVAACEQELQDARTALTELLAEASAELEADKAREAKQAALAALKQQDSELQGRIKALQDELDKGE